MNLPEFLTSDKFGIRITGHRIGLEHIVEDFNAGFSPEMLSEQFPTLPPALIYKTIGFYLENRAAVDAYVAEGHRELERHRAAGRKGPSLEELKRRLELRQRADAKHQATAR